MSSCPLPTTFHLPGKYLAWEPLDLVGAQPAGYWQYWEVQRLTLPPVFPLQLRPLLDLPSLLDSSPILPSSSEEQQPFATPRPSQGKVGAALLEAGAIWGTWREHSLHLGGIPWVTGGAGPAGHDPPPSEPPLHTPQPQDLPPHAKAIKAAHRIPPLTHPPGTRLGAPGASARHLRRFPLPQFTPPSKTGRLALSPPSKAMGRQWAGKWQWEGKWQWAGGLDRLGEAGAQGEADVWDAGGGD